MRIHGRPVSLLIVVALLSCRISIYSESLQNVLFLPEKEIDCLSLSGSGPSKSKIKLIISKSIIPFASTNPVVIVCSVPAKIASPSLCPDQCSPVNTDSISFLVRYVARSEENPGPSPDSKRLPAGSFPVT